ncbi:MAG TPA: M48 family metallopeptidase [Jatrophihabitans sp.]|uniref:M48 family metallopeptidase n=1 Tax=Jatrophihabitans sp. TaxID=1932789 RepID=UPI002E093414|nr:M48 family metallopeptidase [Jatrophihabitans sp.]
MNFFERQRASRATTVKLVVLFALGVLSIVIAVDAVVLIVERRATASTIVGSLIAASAFTLLVIAAGTASKMIALRAGGVAVAQSVGAVAIDPSTSDPRLRRFINIVEEMSIASGVPVPRLFVLEQEPGINAFAAGYSPADAAITVTSGALDTLNRDELQGVIGHEYSHVLNGDMRLNIRLIGLLNGILLLGLIGLRFLQFGGGRSRDSRGSPILAVAIALLILGFVGQFFAGLIKAAVSRQREWLADASSVQFTRQTTGLVGALKKIAGLPAGSALGDKHGEKQISHMLFGEGSRGLSQLYATHPPLLERIKALDPAFNPDEIAQLQQDFAQQPPDGMAEDAALGLAGPAPVIRPAPAMSADSSVRLDAGAIGGRVGRLTPDDLARGARLSGQIPPSLHTLATQSSTAVPLVLALLLDGGEDVRTRQLQVVRARMGGPVAEAAAGYAAEVSPLDPVLRLPLAAIAAPLLAARPADQRAALVTALDEMARVDGRITVFEYCLTRMIASSLSDAAAPGPRSRPGRGTVGSAGDAALSLLAAISAAGNADPAAAEHAFGAAAARLYPGRRVPFTPPADPWRDLDAGWATLDALAPPHKQQLVEALVVAVSDDGVLTIAEAELLRTTCALLHCPLPPLVA